MKIYIAGPLFNQAERALNEQIDGILRECGHETFLPQKAGGVASDLPERIDGVPIRQYLFQLDCRHLDWCDTVLFIFDGRVPDEGASFELGYCYAKGKRCIGFKTDARSFMNGFDNLMLSGALETVLRSEQELRMFFLRENPAIRKEKSCGAVVYRKVQGGLEFLLEHMVQGHVSLPKGHVEGTETEEETALREIREETNLEAALDTSFRHVITYAPSPEAVKDVVFFIAEAREGKPVRQESEVAALAWMPYGEAMDALTHDSDKQTLAAAYRHLQGKHPSA